MSHHQLKSPNLAVVGQSGWCLAYVTEVFGIAPHYPSAISAWNNSSYKHPGEQPPGDVAVPVFFSYNGPYGHVAVAVPGRGIWSTSAQGDKVFNTVSELVRWMGEGFVYLGWSEDLNNVRVMETVSDAPLWWTEPINKQVTVRTGMYKWNLARNDFNDVANNPIERLDAPRTFTAVALLHHRNIPQYNYYLEDANTPHGYNVIDCDDYAPPPPPPPPYVPPAAPAKAEPAETYDVITKLMVFPSAVDAKSLSNYTGADLEPGTYYVFAKQDNAYNLSTNNVQNQNKWVRITDNVVKAEPTPEPVQPTLPVDAPATDETLPVDLGPAPQITDVFKPEAPKPQYNWIRDDRLPVRLTSTNSTPVPIHDLEGKYPTQSFPAHRTEDYSMFTVVDGTEYWLPDRTRNKGWMYAVPLQFLPEEPAPTLLDHNGNGKYDIVDLFDNGIAGFVDFGSKYLDGIKRAVTVVAPKIEPAKQRIGKTIDGFSARRKK